jgi:hypothetical protein
MGLSGVNARHIAEQTKHPPTKGVVLPVLLTAARRLCHFRRNNMRVTGRTVRPSTLAERRLMLSVFGTSALRIPRKTNPYLAARKLARAARHENDDLLFVQAAVSGCRPRVPAPTPGTDLPEPGREPIQAADDAAHVHAA